MTCHERQQQNKQNKKQQQEKIKQKQNKNPSYFAYFCNYCINVTCHFNHFSVPTVTAYTDRTFKTITIDSIKLIDQIIYKIPAEHYFQHTGLALFGCFRHFRLTKDLECVKASVEKLSIWHSHGCKNTV